VTESTDKIALFIDGANLYATAKTLGFDIDYKRLLKELQSRGTLGTRVLLHGDYRGSGIFVDSSVVTKATKEFIDASGRRKVKGNMDIELAVPATAISARWSRRCSAAASADDRRRIAAPGRRLHRPRGTAIQARPRALRSSGVAPEPVAVAAA
jgi:uncharacterized LabA/DUF88 family protein